MKWKNRVFRLCVRIRSSILRSLVVYPKSNRCKTVKKPGLLRCLDCKETTDAMSFYSLMNCNYCGSFANTFCKGDRCGQKNDLHSFLCDDCLRVHERCRLCQEVIRTHGQTVNPKDGGTEMIDLESHVNIIRTGQRQCANCGSGETNLLVLKLCSACKNALYCDSVCQRKDWFRHKVHTCSFGKL